MEAEDEFEDEFDQICISEHEFLPEKQQQNVCISEHKLFLKYTFQNFFLFFSVCTSGSNTFISECCWLLVTIPTPFSSLLHVRYYQASKEATKVLSIFSPGTLSKYKPSVPDYKTTGTWNEEAIFSHNNSTSKNPLCHCAMDRN